MTLSDAFIAALVGALVAIILNRSRTLREDRFRFAELKLGRYERLTKHVSRALIDAFEHHKDLKNAKRSRKAPEQPSLRHLSQGEMRGWATELRLVAPPKVVDVLSELIEITVMVFYDFYVEESEFLEDDDRWWDERTAARDERYDRAFGLFRKFLDVAREDLGLPRSLRERLRDRRGGAYGIYAPSRPATK